MASKSKSSVWRDVLWLLLLLLLSFGPLRAVGCAGGAGGEDEAARAEAEPEAAEEGS
jgi:hypothetical protein